MNSSNPLCCCEFYDTNHERSHILACCCNCQDLDENFESPKEDTRDGWTVKIVPNFNKIDWSAPYLYCKMFQFEEEEYNPQNRTCNINLFNYERGGKKFCFMFFHPQSFTITVYKLLITCKNISPKHKQGMLLTLQDRIRIPWIGGAKQIPIDSILPVVILTAGFIVAAVSLHLTIVASIITLALLVYFNKNLPKKYPRTKFFFMWSCYSVVILYFIFEYFVVPYLEILLEENITVGIFTIGFVICIYMMKKKSSQLQYAQLGSGKVEQGRSMQCSVCLISVPDGDYHTYWFDCCIGQHNQFYYVLAKICAIAALVYSANLTLTSVCHPFTFYKTILLPDDCSDVYQEMDLGISFVSAVYSLVLGLLFLLSLLHQILLISLGFTWQEWRDLSCSRKICCCIANRPYTRGICCNWFRAITNSFCRQLY